MQPNMGVVKSAVDLIIDDDNNEKEEELIFGPTQQEETPTPQEETPTPQDEIPTQQDETPTQQTEILRLTRSKALRDQVNSNQIVVVEKMCKKHDRKRNKKTILFIKGDRVSLKIPSIDVVVDTNS